MPIEMHCIIKGRVQGVMFRDFAQRKARSLGIVGTVENMHDGSVEVIAQGKEENLKKLLQLLHHGPLLSRIRIRIDSVDAEWREPMQNFDDFKIIY